MELLLNSDRSKNDDKETKWSFIRGNFFAKECSHFVPQLGKCDENGCPLCFCGAVEADHYADVRSISARNAFWSEDDIVKMPTNAYGKLLFAGLDVEQKAKYLRLSDDSVLESTLKLFTDHWKLMENEPELLISLFGDGPEFNMATSLKKQIFNRGLIPAVEITKGWITTFGLNVGVAKAVGEAICEGQYYFGEGLKTKALVQCIGIVPWSAVRDTHALTCSGEEDDTNSKTYHRCYDVDPGILPGQPISLNPFHTHFLLVDDGRRNEHSNVAKFRAALEKKISTAKE
uniref:TRPM SLOG domain-containing protein n=1 Tax=Romanomermis culicivorax TaxID=13658 RepID=A0A915JIN3_ROMCU